MIKSANLRTPDLFLLVSSILVLLFGLFCFISDLPGSLNWEQDYWNRLKTAFAILLHARVLVHLVYFLATKFRHTGKSLLPAVALMEGLLIVFFWTGSGMPKDIFGITGIEFLTGFWLFFL